MSELSILNDVLINVRNGEFVQYVKALEEENESVKLFGKANYPLLTPQESNQKISYNRLQDNKKFAGVVAVGATEYPREEVGTAEQADQYVVKIATEQSYTMEDEDKLEKYKNYLAKSGAVDYIELLKALEFEKKPSALYRRIYNTMDMIAWVGSTKAEAYRKSKNKSMSFSLMTSSVGEAYGVLNHPDVRGTSDARVLSTSTLNTKTRWADKYAETGGSENIINDIVNMKNTLDNDLIGFGISNSQKQLILPSSLITFLKQKPYDQSNNLGRKLYYEICERIGFVDSQIVGSETMDLFPDFKGYGILMVKDNNYFGCINSGPLPLQDEYRKDTTIISANAKTAGFKCALPSGIRLIKGLA